MIGVMACIMSFGKLRLMVQSVSLQRVKNRPVSPHVFEEGGTKFHYNMPINAVTSIMNRATGVMLTVGAPPMELTSTGEQCIISQPLLHFSVNGGCLPYKLLAMQASLESGGSH